MHYSNPQKKSTLLITGASSGLGKQLALCYAAPRVHLILIARNEQNLQEVAQKCQQAGATTICASIDVQNTALLKSFILDRDDQTPIDIVIANAGVTSTLQSNWQPEKEDDIERVFSINTLGTVHTINPLIDRMIARQNGQIVIISSSAGLRGLPQSPSYCASKAATLTYGQSLRSWLARYHVKVTVVCPGYIQTDMIEDLHGPKPFLISSEKAAKMIQRGLRKNKARMVFPWQINLLTRLTNILPARLVDAFLNCFESYVK